MRTVKSLVAAVPLLLATTVMAQIDARLLRYPAVSATTIAFVYAGDIWVVDKQGGVAQHLSTPLGEESFPRFSPDGSHIAYTADYDGNPDIYVVPVGGGLPKRITYHPAPDRMLGWYPDGKAILFASSMESGKDRFNQLYKVSAAGGLPEKLPVPYGEFGEISPDGQNLAYMPESRDFRTWKRYRGGWAPDIWLFNLAKLTARNLTANDANDAQPMWYGANTIYFLSDRDAAKRANIWVYDLITDAVREVTHFEEFDVHFPSIGPSDIVFEAGGRLWRLDLPGEKLHEVKVEVVTDRATLKPRAENVAKLISNVDISPSGKRVFVEARGEIFSLPAEHGVTMNLTQSSGVAERNPAVSADGKSIAYFSDRSGEYELTVRPADGTGSERKVTAMGPGFRYHIAWSPDGRKVAFVDQTMAINVCDVASGAVTPIDKGLFLFQGNLDAFTFSWSADSRWLAYARDTDNQQRVIVLYDSTNGQRHEVVSAFYDAAFPTFDPDGKYLYLITGRTFKPIYSDVDNSFIYANTSNVAAIPLRADVASPLAPRNDVEGEDAKKDEKKDEQAKGGEKSEAAGKGKEKGEAEAKAPAKEPPKPVAIDLAGFEQRLVVLPPEAGNYGGLAAVSGKLIYRRLPRTGAADEKSPVLYWDLEEREEKTIVGDADGFALAAEAKKLLVWKKDSYAIVEVKADQKMEKKLATAELETVVDPVAEWHQIFADAWRIERDFFYDPNMHKVNWAEMRQRYGKLLDDAVTRWDVNFVLGELIGELNSSHTYRGGGDLEKPLERGVGLLGADFTLENGAYRIAHILAGAPWDSEARSPLRQPGVKVEEGDYLLAVNRTPIDTTKAPWAAFAGLAGKTVMLTVNSQPSMAGAREVLVDTLADDYRLRNLAWIEQKRLMVERATGGRVAYVYVPNTGVDGQTELVRQLRGQIAAEGLIVDERFNSGGQIPDRFVELLNRPVYNYWAVRDGRDWQWPPVSQVGPKVMLINGWSGSGGDCFPFYFREAGVGPLIGSRTWGGLIGISGTPALMDGGTVTAPTFAIYSKKGEWIIEGHGVDPDIAVVDDPAKMVNGGDPQLERAISEVMQRLQANPPVRPKRPPYPDRAGR
jgi:tricorn protease